MSYSRFFDVKTDSLITHGDIFDPCITNFNAISFCSFVQSNAGASYFEKGERIIGSRRHFSLIAKDSSGSSLAEYVGELPCPDNCLPGEPLTSFNKFHPDHINEIVCNSFVIKYLSLQKCLVNQVMSYAIYAHTGDIPLRNVDMGHKVYVSIQ